MTESSLSFGLSADVGCDKEGSPFGSSRSGTATFGAACVAAGTKGSPEGPALAGAIIVAVSAATISSAERKEANILTVKLAVNPPNGAPNYSRILAPATLVIPRLAWQSRQ